MSGRQQAMHARESYFVVGEGLLGESADGRTATANGVLATAPLFRFSRIGPKGTALSEATRKKIANAMTPVGGAASDIPAGFTYLGQFVDHDLTFDKTQVMLGEDVSPAELIQGRSPSLDLDSLYGAGPQDEESAKFYKDDRHLKMGKTVAAGPDAARDGFDLPRVGGTGTAAAKRKALIPDFRNDENLAVAQTHLAMIRFHNRVVDNLPSVPTALRFATARKRVVKHYQWMVRHDFLPRICQASVLDDVFSNGRKIFEVNATPTDVPTMPIEFSVAAYRLGHSMIRAAYDWNARFPDGAGTLDLLFEFSGTSGTLGGNPRLPSNWIADFRRLYHFNRKDLAVPEAQFNRAMRIDARLVNPLKNLPPGAFGGPPVPVNDPTANLAFRNLTRAKMVRLATGQQMVTLLKARGVPVGGLTKSQILNGNNTLQLGNLTSAQRDSLATNTPLWFYILREAELNDGKLKGVGARIVAETFHRAIEGSKFSIVRDTNFHPTLGPDNATFRMVDLLLFAFEGKKSLLAPLG
jgi:Animal haem peroxidase